MSLGDKALHFFLGANTPQGFVSRFDQLAPEDQGWRKLVIKGGPGSGKSTMMKQVAQAFGQAEENMELIHCSSDADSLDGVILHGKKCSIADGTSPHGRAGNVTNSQIIRPKRRRAQELERIPLLEDGQAA